MMDTIFEGILDPYFTMISEGLFHSCFIIGVVIVAVALACLLLYWNKSSSKLRVRTDDSDTEKGTLTIVYSSCLEIYLYL